MGWLLNLIDQCDGVVVEGDAAVPVCVGDQAGGAEAKFAGPLTRDKVGARAEIGPVHIRLLEDLKGFLMRLGNRKVLLGQMPGGNQSDSRGDFQRPSASNDDQASVAGSSSPLESH